MESKDVAPILEDVNPALDGSSFEASTATVFSCDLPFYPGYKFLELSDYETTPANTKYVVYKDNDVTVLDWSNGPIYSLNNKIPIKLTKENVSDYVRFFFTYVRGQHGRFLIAETVDDIHWKEEPPPAARKAIGKMLEPIHVTGQDSDKTYNILARMMFKDSLFKSSVHVKPSGSVSLSGEELLVEDMPVLDDTLGL